MKTKYSNLLIIILLLNLILSACNSLKNNDIKDSDLSGDSEINTQYVIKVKESNLKDLDSINRLLTNNKKEIIAYYKSNYHNKYKIEDYFFSKKTLNAYLPDSTINRGFLKRCEFSMIPDNNESKFKLKSFHFNFKTNKATYRLESKSLKRVKILKNGKKFDYNIVESLDYNKNFDSIVLNKKNIMYVEKLDNNWIYSIYYVKHIDDHVYKNSTKEETEYLKKNYLKFFLDEK